VKANINRLVETKKAHYIAVIKTNQPTAYAQLRPALDVDQGPAHRLRHRPRPPRVPLDQDCAIADNLGGIAFPYAHLAIRVHRRCKPTGRAETRENVYAVTSLAAHQTRPADLAAAIRGHWGIENSSHYIRDVTFAEDASTIHTGTAPRAMATIRNLAIGTLKILGADNIAKTTRAIRHEPERALAILASPTTRTLTELDQALTTDSATTTSKISSRRVLPRRDNGGEPRKDGAP
ncbi:hypothetical protein ABTX79_36575, partial [Streptomyces sp. NPDC096153]